MIQACLGCGEEFLSQAKKNECGTSPARNIPQPSSLWYDGNRENGLIGMRLGSSDDLPDFNNTEVLWV